VICAVIPASLVGGANSSNSWLSGSSSISELLELLSLSLLSLSLLEVSDGFLFFFVTWAHNLMFVYSLSADDVGVGARGVLARGRHDVRKDKK